MRTSRATALAVGLGTGLLAVHLAAQSVPVVTGDERVDKLLSQMTLQEKLTPIHGTHEDPKVDQGQAGYLGGVPKLGIPGLLDDKALTGEEVAAAAGTDPDATGGSCGRGSRWGWRLSMPVAGSR